MEIEGEVVGSLADRDFGAGDAGDVAVQRVGGLEHRRGAPGAAVREAHGLEHLVGAVGGEDLLGRNPVMGGDRLAQGRVRAIGVAVPVEVRHLGGERRGEAHRRWFRGLVGVEAHGHRDLGRVVALHEREVIARRHGHARSRTRATQRQRRSGRGCATGCERRSASGGATEHGLRGRGTQRHSERPSAACVAGERRHHSPCRSRMDSACASRHSPIIP